MRLLLVRHAPTAETGSRLTGRAPGVGLSSDGRAQAVALGKRLSGVSVDALYTSPVLRCRETARPLAEEWSLDAVPYRSFSEVDYGAWTGRSLGSLRRTNLWRQLMVAPARVRFPGGETLVEVQARAVAACEDLGARHGDGTVCVVSHADVIRLLLAHYLGTAIDLYHRLSVAPASVSVVDLPAKGPPRVPVVNCGEVLAG